MKAINKIMMISQANLLFNELTVEHDLFHKIEIIQKLSILLEKLKSKVKKSILSYGESLNPFPLWAIENEMGISGKKIRECIYVKNDNFALYLSSINGLSGAIEKGWDFSRGGAKPMPCSLTLPFLGFTNTQNLDVKTRRQAYSALKKSISLVKKTLPLTVNNWIINIYDSLSFTTYTLKKDNITLHLPGPLRDVIKTIESNDIAKHVKQYFQDKKNTDLIYKQQYQDDKSKGQIAFEYISNDEFKKIDKIIRTNFIKKSFEYDRNLVLDVINLLTKINTKRLKLSTVQIEQLQEAKALIPSVDFWLKVEYQQLIEQNKNYQFKE